MQRMPRQSTSGEGKESIESEVRKMSYRDELVQRIKEAGQELIDRAENMVDKEVDYITDFDIYINLHPEGDCVEIPTIQWNTTVANRNTLKRKWGE